MHKLNEMAEFCRLLLLFIIIIVIIIIYIIIFHPQGRSWAP